MNSSDGMMILVSLLSSFIGSWHCALMCGPIAANYRTGHNLFFYQAGRLISYVMIGAISGKFGAILLSSQYFFPRIFLGIVFGIVLIFSALQQLRSKSNSNFASNFLSRIYLRILRTIKSLGFLNFPFVGGLLTALLPCAWLFTWILAAANSHSAGVGGVLLFILWLGGVPALSAISIFIKRGHQLSSTKQKKVLFVVLLFSGLYAILSQLLFGLGIFQG